MRILFSPAILSSSLNSSSSEMRRSSGLLFCSSSVLFRWKLWDSRLEKEVRPGAHPVDPVPMDTVPLLEYTKANRAMFIQGSPGCGKSSLARLIKEHAEEKGYYRSVVVHRAYENNGGISFGDRVRPIGGVSPDKVLLIVDDAEAQIAKELVNPTEMYRSGCHVLYLGTTAQATAACTTPAEILPHKHWMYAPSLDRKVVRGFAARVLVHHGADTKEAARLAKQAFDCAGASMGVLIKLLNAIVDSEGKFPTAGGLLLKERYQPRVVVDREPVLPKDPVKIAIAKELLAVGKVTVDGDSPEPWKELLRQGFICPLRNFEDIRPIVPWKDDPVDFGWAHSLQVNYCALFRGRITPQRTEWLPEATCTTPIDAVLRLVSSFAIEFFIPSIINVASKNSSGKSNFDVQPYQATKYTFPGMRVLGDMRSSKDGDELAGRLNFVVLPDEKRDVWWGFELLVRNKKRQRHTDRFLGGKYNGLVELADSLMLDCYTEPLLKEKASRSAKLATISPHLAEGWNVIVLDYRGKRVNIPRDGVPRYVADWTAAAPEAKVARRARAAPAPLRPKMKRAKSQR